MKSNYEVIPFENVARLEAITLGLPTASLSEVEVDGVSDEQNNRFKAVVNNSTHEVETMVSDKYLLINHRQIFEPVVQAMKNLGINVTGKVIIDGGRCYADILFDDPRFKVDVSKGEQMQKLRNHEKTDIINFGMRFFNSYDKTKSFGAEVFGLRLICLNGMVAPVKLESIREAHTGDKKLVIKSIVKLFERLAEESPKFADVVSRTRQEIVTVKLFEELLNSWKIGEKNIKKILQVAKKQDELNGWTCYNILTDFISHTMQVRESTKERWHKKYANQLLKMPMEALIVRSKAKGE